MGSDPNAMWECLIHFAYTNCTKCISQIYFQRWHPSFSENWNFLYCHLRETLVQWTLHQKFFNKLWTNYIKHAEQTPFLVQSLVFHKFIYLCYLLQLITKEVKIVVNSKISMKRTIFSRQILDCNNNGKTGDEPLKTNSKCFKKWRLIGFD